MVEQIQANTMEEKVGMSASDIQRVNILRRRFTLTNSISKYFLDRLEHRNPSINYVRTNLLALFMEIQVYLERTLTAEQFITLKKICWQSMNEAEILDAVYLIEQRLDKLKITKLDLYTDFEGTVLERSSQGRRI